MTSQTGQKIITIQILPNISRSKGPTRQRNKRLWHEKYFFLEISHTKFGGEASPRPFYEKWKLSISLDQEPKMM